MSSWDSIVTYFKRFCVVVFRSTRLVFWLSAPCALGLLVGWLTGLSGADATVLAAVLPAVISLGGALFFPRLVFWGLPSTSGAPQHSAQHSGRTLLTTYIVVFSLSLYVSAEYSYQRREYREDMLANLQLETDRMEAEGAIELRRRIEFQNVIDRNKQLEICTNEEIHINNRREKEGLDRLPKEYFCGVITE